MRLDFLLKSRVEKMKIPRIDAISSKNLAYPFALICNPFNPNMGQAASGFNIAVA